MLIDWFTVAAQAVNFLILVWLLKRFLYKPILLAIDTREKATADKIAQAEATQNAAEKNLEEFQKQRAEFDRQRADLLKKAIDEAKVQRQGLFDQAQRDFDSLRSQQQESLARERERVEKSVAESTCREVFDIARKALSDLASTTLEESIADMFVQRLRALTPDERGHLAAASPSATPKIAHVRSAFGMPAEQQTTIMAAVKEALGGNTEVRFEPTPSLVSGIELTTEGYRVSWNVPDYLTTLETHSTDAKKSNNAS